MDRRIEIPCNNSGVLHPSSTIYNKKIDFKQKDISDVTSKIHFYLKLIFLSKRSGQKKNEGKIFSIPHNSAVCRVFFSPSIYTVRPSFRVMKKK
jgi:hypothetical protein